MVYSLFATEPGVPDPSFGGAEEALDCSAIMVAPFAGPVLKKYKGYWVTYSMMNVHYNQRLKVIAYESRSGTRYIALSNGRNGAQDKIRTARSAIQRLEDLRSSTSIMPCLVRPPRSFYFFEPMAEFDYSKLMCLAPELSWELLPQALDGLKKFHDTGYYHGDAKIDNLFFYLGPIAPDEEVNEDDDIVATSVCETCHLKIMQNLGTKYKSTPTHEILAAGHNPLLAQGHRQWSIVGTKCTASKFFTGYLPWHDSALRFRLLARYARSPPDSRKIHYHFKCNCVSADTGPWVLFRPRVKWGDVEMLTKMDEYHYSGNSRHRHKWCSNINNHKTNFKNALTRSNNITKSSKLFDTFVPTPIEEERLRTIVKDFIETIQDPDVLLLLLVTLPLYLPSVYADYTFGTPFNEVLLETSGPPKGGAMNQVRRSPVYWLSVRWQALLMKVLESAKAGSEEDAKDLVAETLEAVNALRRYN
jgi:hypothetical protein